MGMRKVYSLLPCFLMEISLSFSWLSCCCPLGCLFTCIFLNNGDVNMVSWEFVLQRPPLQKLSVLPEENILALFSPYCLSSFLLYLPHHVQLVGQDRRTLIPAVSSPLLFPLPHLNPRIKRLGCKNCPGGVVPSLRGSRVAFCMWQAHGCTFCLCLGAVVDWQGTDGNSILYSQSSARPYSSPGSKGWTEGLEKLGVSEWVLIFNSALIHLRDREGRLWVVQSLWGVSDTLKAFLPSSVAIPWSNRNRGPHRNPLSLRTQLVRLGNWGRGALFQTDRKTSNMEGRKNPLK